MRSSCENDERGLASARRGTNHLHADHEDRVGRELAPAEVEEVLQAGPEQVDHHDVVLVLRAEPVDLRDALLACEVLVQS